MAKHVPDSDRERGARAPRPQFGAPSRRTLRAERDRSKRLLRRAESTSRALFGPPEPCALPILCVFSVGFRESDFQALVARASRPCVGCPLRTGGTPVPLCWKRRGRRNCV